MLHDFPKRQSPSCSLHLNGAVAHDGSDEKENATMKGNTDHQTIIVPQWLDSSSQIASDLIREPGVAMLYMDEIEERAPHRPHPEIYSELKDLLNSDIQVSSVVRRGAST
jgi:hypothetical protein